MGRPERQRENVGAVKLFRPQNDRNPGGGNRGFVSGRSGWGDTLLRSSYPANGTGIGAVPALSWAAFCHFGLVVDGWAEAPETSRSKAIDLARLALGVAQNDPGILAVAAFVLAYFGEDIDARLRALGLRGLGTLLTGQSAVLNGQ